MGPILTSFLCGLSFVGGAFLMTAMVLVYRRGSEKEWKEELGEYWKQSIALHEKQVATLVELVTAINRKEKK